MLKASQPISISMVAPEVQPEPEVAPEPPKTEPVPIPRPEPKLKVEKSGCTCHAGAANHGTETKANSTPTLGVFADRKR